MKKILAITLLLALLTLGATACSDLMPGGAKPTATTAPAQATAEPTEAPTEAPAEATATPEATAEN